MAEQDARARAITEFLDSKTQNPDCPWCGTNRWTLMGEWPYARVDVTNDPAAAGPLQAYFPAYMLHCENCGFVRFHMKYTVDGQSEPSVGTGR